MIMPENTIRANFDKHWRLDKKTGCHNWLAGKCRGYGTIRLDDRVNERAHRFAWMRLNGPIPDGMQCLHKCDNPTCVNVAHLYVGTHRDNMRDVRGKHRRWGEGKANAKLTESQVRQIRYMRKSGKSRDALSGRFGVHKNTIRDIEIGRTWVDVR